MKNTIDLLIEDIQFWKVPTKEQFESYVNWVAARNNSKTKKQPVSKISYQWSVSQVINPLQMYLYLKTRFGEANGLSMAFINKGTSDNIYHWEYMIVSNGKMITFTGYTFHFNILIHEVLDKRQDDEIRILKAISRDFGSYRKEMDQLFKNLEEWQLFINPFFHYSDLVSELFEKLKLTRLAKPTKFTRPNNAKEFQALVDLNKKLHEAFSIGSMLKLLIPVWIESYVNLIFVLMAKESIKRDKGRFKTLKRQSIFVKIKDLSTNCNGFTASVTDAELKDLKRLFKTRNRYLHGSVEPQSDRTTTMYFDSKYIPLFNINTYSPHLVRKLLLNEIDEDQLDKEITIGEEFILLLFSKIHSKYANSLIRLTNESRIGWDRNRFILGAVLPSQFPDLFFYDEGKGKPSKKSK